MNTKVWLVPTIIVSVIVSIIVVIMMGVSVLGIYNDEASLKNRYEMKIKDNQSEMDNMWKTISQVCQLADSKKDAFKEIFTGYASSATPQDSGKVMLWLKQNTPTVDLNVYDKAQNIIVSSRDGWTMRQKELVGITEVYNNNLVVMPGGAFLNFFGFKHIDPLVITSTRTENAFSTGKDDDVKIK